MPAMGIGGTVTIVGNWVSQLCDYSLNYSSDLLSITAAGWGLLTWDELDTDGDNTYVRVDILNSDDEVQIANLTRNPDVGGVDLHEYTAIGSTPAAGSGFIGYEQDIKVKFKLYSSNEKTPIVSLKSLAVNQPL